MKNSCLFIVIITLALLNLGCVAVENPTGLQDLGRNTTDDSSIDDSDDNLNDNNSNNDDQIILASITGEVDDSFAADGEFLLAGLDSSKFKTGVDLSLADVTGAALASDGSIYVIGCVGITYCLKDNGTFDGILFKLKSTGELDENFANGNGYKVISRVGGDTSLDTVLSVDIDPSDNIIIGGYTKPGNQKQVYLQKLKADGSLDTNFATAGTFIIEQSHGQTFGAGIDSDTGAINIVAPINGTTVYRVLADGSGYDTSFSDDGIYNFGDNHYWRPGFLLASSGELIVHAYRNMGGNRRDAISWVLDQTGSINESYGDPCIHADLAGGTGDDKWIKAIPVNEAEILFVGYSSSATNNTLDSVAAKVNKSNCSYDTTFAGGRGYWTTDFSGNDKRDYISDAIVQDDGSIIAGLKVTRTKGSGDDYDIALIRLTENGEQDMEFANGGTLWLGTEYSDGSPKLLKLTDGRLLVAASKGNANGTGMAVWLVK